MPRGMHPCSNCGISIGNAARRCRHCGAGEPSSHRAGYKRVYSPGHPMAAKDGYALEHRWMLHEMAIPIPDGHQVHHRNGVKDDNSWSNLEILPEGQHHSLHVGDMAENQFGLFPVIRDPEQRRLATNAWRRAWRKRTGRS